MGLRAVLYGVHLILQGLMLFLLMIFFILIMTPVGLWKRGRGWDPLRMKDFKGPKTTFWQKSDVPQKGTFSNQF
jgi:hypothetical protein